MTENEFIAAFRECLSLSPIHPFLAPLNLAPLNKGAIRIGVHCPITFVAVCKGGEGITSAGSVGGAVRFLNLEVASSDIVNAADNYVPRNPFSKRARLRRKLLRAAGLRRFF